MIELAEKVLEMTNSNSKLVKVQARSDDPERRRPDITLAKKRLGWEPKIKLEEGLKPTIDYFDDLLKRS
jgi:UDP-glucuronate decarboxylase